MGPGSWAGTPEQEDFRIGPGASRKPDRTGGKGEDSRAGNQDGTGSVDPGQLSSTPERVIHFEDPYQDHMESAPTDFYRLQTTFTKFYIKSLSV